MIPLKDIKQEEPRKPLIIGRTVFRNAEDLEELGRQLDKEKEEQWGIPAKIVDKFEEIHRTTGRKVADQVKEFKAIEEMKVKERQTRDEDFEEIKATRKKAKEDNRNAKFKTMMEKIKPIRERNEKEVLNKAFDNLAEETIKYRPEKFHTPLEQDPLIMKFNKDLIRDKKFRETFEKIKPIKERNEKESTDTAFYKIAREALKDRPENLVNRANAIIEDYQDLKSEGAKLNAEKINQLRQTKQYLKKLGVKFNKNDAQYIEPLTVSEFIDTAKPALPPKKRGRPAKAQEAPALPPKKRGRPPKGGAMKKTKKTKKTKETAQERKKRMEYIRSFKKK